MQRIFNGWRGDVLTRTCIAAAAATYGLSLHLHCGKRAPLHVPHQSARGCGARLYAHACRGVRADAAVRGTLRWRTAAWRYNRLPAHRRVAAVTRRRISARTRRLTARR